MKQFYKLLRYALPVAILAMAVLGCSRKSDSWVNRTYHKMTSKYNPYFNGEQAYLEGVETIERGHIENYEEIIPVYIWGTPEQGTAVAPKMDRAIEKGAKVIRDHSMVVGGKQQNSYVIKSYLLLGRARFYKQDFFPALETFNYVIQQFSKDKKAANMVTEARLWAGWCQLRIGNTISAESYFDDLIQTKKIDKKYLPDVYASKAQAAIDAKLYEIAAENLTEALKANPTREQRIRWTFVRAQLYERIDKNYESSRDYKEVIKLKPRSYEMLFTAQLNRARNFDVYMENPTIVYRELEKMLKDDKNIEYRDQIYYVMAQVAVAEEEWERADDYLKKSVRASVSNNSQKGLSYLKIADINFTFKEYLNAAAYYDSASFTLPPGHKRFAYANKRKLSLAGLVKNIGIITTEDSLQRLAGLSEAEQRKIFERYIKNLKDEEERKQREAELAELNKDLVNQTADNGPTVGQTGGWYFYNPTTRAAGLASFQRVWGSRKLEDNWRQKNKQQVVTENTNGDGADSTKAKNYSGDKYNPEFYLAQIPQTQAELDTSNARIMKAYVALGDIYNQELADYKLSEESYTKVLKRYPACIYEPRVLYSLYRLMIVQGKEKDAEPFKKRLIDDYPRSIYTRQLLDPTKQKEGDEVYKAVAAFYKKEYELYQKKQYKTVLADLDKERKLYQNSPLEPKCELLACMCLGKLQRQPELITRLKDLIANFPNSGEALAAQEILNLVDEPVANNGPALKNNFIYNANEPHKFVVIMPNQGVDINTIRNEVANFNQEFYKLDRLQVQNIFFDQSSQMVTISGFANAAKARVYYSSFLANQKIMGYLPAQVTTKLIISDANYKELYKEKNLEEYLKFLKDKYQIGDSI